jgi:hypothetical protein
MKKIASILMASMVLLSVLNLTVGAHFCHDKVMEVKMSLVNQTSHSCGMESPSSSAPTGNVFKSKCCSNESASLKVDSNYAPSVFKNLPVFQKEIHVSAVLLSELVQPFADSKISKPLFSPPEKYPLHSVDLAAICVFRI